MAAAARVERDEAVAAAGFTRISRVTSAVLSAGSVAGKALARALRCATYRFVRKLMSLSRQPTAGRKETEVRHFLARGYDLLFKDEALAARAADDLLRLYKRLHQHDRRGALTRGRPANVDRSCLVVVQAGEAPQGTAAGAYMHEVVANRVITITWFVESARAAMAGTPAGVNTVGGGSTAASSTAASSSGSTAASSSGSTAAGDGGTGSGSSASAAGRYEEANASDGGSDREEGSTSSRGAGRADHESGAGDGAGCAADGAAGPAAGIGRKRRLAAAGHAQPQFSQPRKRARRSDEPGRDGAASAAAGGGAAVAGGGAAAAGDAAGDGAARALAAGPLQSKGKGKGDGQASNLDAACAPIPQAARGSTAAGASPGTRTHARRSSKASIGSFSQSSNESSEEPGPSHMASATAGATASSGPGHKAGAADGATLSGRARAHMQLAAVYLGRAAAGAGAVNVTTVQAYLAAVRDVLAAPRELGPAPPDGTLATLGYQVVRGAVTPSAAFLARVAAAAAGAQPIFNNNGGDEDGVNDNRRRQEHVNVGEADLVGLAALLQAHAAGLTANTWVALASDAGCSAQVPHMDWPPSAAFRAAPAKPCGLLVALQDGTTLDVWPGALSTEPGRWPSPVPRCRVRLQAGDALLFRGDLVHAGSAYSAANVRLHCYLDAADVSRPADRTWFVDAAVRARILD
jgi:hypothetical protein